MLSFARYAWPALLALAVWVFGWMTDRQGSKTLGWVLGWTLLAWAALRCPNGATLFLAVLAAFLLLQVVIPALRRLCAVAAPSRCRPRRRQRRAVPRRRSPLLLLAGLAWLSWCGTGCVSAPPGNSKSPLTATGAPLADSVTQDIRVEDKFALGTAKIRWQAEKDDMLPLLFEPTVLTRVDYPTNAAQARSMPPRASARRSSCSRRRAAPSTSSCNTSCR